jgi:hypothetical protein
MLDVAAILCQSHVHALVIRLDRRLQLFLCQQLVALRHATIMPRFGLRCLCGFQLLRQRGQRAAQFGITRRKLCCIIVKIHEKHFLSRPAPPVLLFFRSLCFLGKNPGKTPLFFRRKISEKLRLKYYPLCVDSVQTTISSNFIIAGSNQHCNSFAGLVSVVAPASRGSVSLLILCRCPAWCIFSGRGASRCPAYFFKGCPSVRPPGNGHFFRGEGGYCVDVPQPTGAEKSVG